MRNALSAALLVGLAAGCTCGAFDPSTTRFACNTDADCAEGFTCQPAGEGKECLSGTVVVTPRANGASCTASRECGSSFCVSGVCCNSSCGDECESCAVAGSVGRCLPKATGTTCRNDYRCDGATGTCPLTCTDVAQCALARDCVNGACVDLDECNGPSGMCGANAVCANTPGSWQCSCETGFLGATITGGPAICVDVDECQAAPDCGPLAVCSNTPGSWECSCPSGTFGATVTGGPTSCSTVNRCVAPGMCGANATCATTSTSYSCTCQAGYAGSTTMGGPASCTDANECNTPNVCGDNAGCTNTVGSFQCACLPGFAGQATTGTAATCIDQDECPTTNCGTNAHCTNSPGSYVCSCDTGFMGADVTGGPATCTVLDRCQGVSCGANATCVNGPNNYTCSCAPGFQGASVIGAPASCSDVDECAVSNACGANANCANSQGSYTCTCAAGFTGPTTTGMPTTCVAGVTRLGQGQGLGSLTITLTQAVPAGARVALAYTAANSSGATVTDSRANTWVRVVNDSSCGACGSAGLFTVTLTNPWGIGDTVTVGPSNTMVGAWLVSLNAFTFLDGVGTVADNDDTDTPIVSTSAAVIEPDELRIAALATRNTTTLTPGAAGGFATELSFTNPALSSIIASSLASGLSGVQTFRANSSSRERFSGFIATFYGGTQAAPTGLSLTHTANNRGFTVSWTGGRGNGGPTGCAVQYRSSPSVWTTLLVTNCDTTATARAVNLPAGLNWFGAAWSSLQVRLLRLSDSVVLGTFATNLTCATRSSSSTPTPTIDENCDSTWDDHSCLNYGWVVGAVYPTTFAACTNSGDTTASKACTSANEAESRYTDGMGTTSSPGIAWSSSQFGSGCMGTYTGATTWTCTGSNCSYR